MKWKVQKMNNAYIFINNACIYQLDFQFQLCLRENEFYLWNWKQAFGLRYHWTVTINLVTRYVCDSMSMTVDLESVDLSMFKSTIMIDEYKNSYLSTNFCDHLTSTSLSTILLAEVFLRGRLYFKNVRFIDVWYQI